MKSKIKKYYKENGLFKTIKWLTEKTINRIKLKINIKKTINSKEGNTKNYSRKRPIIFMFASVPYFDIGGGQRSAQLSKVFNKKNYDIVYIYGLPTSESKIFNLEYPTIIHKYVKKYKEKDFSEMIQKDDIVIFEMPTKEFLPFLKIAYEKNTKIVYENIDNWETSLGNKFFNKEILKEFLTKGTILTATAKNLKEQLENYLKELNIKKEIIYSPNAVNDELFDPYKDYEKPKDLVVGEKTFLYYGSLWGTWFNWEIINELAENNKNYQINLIGDEKTIPEIVKNKKENINFLGLKKQTDLPKYLKHTDYSILPFKKDEISNYVSPLKIFEYISMNTKVLTTSLPDIKDYPNTFYGDTYKEWKEIIDKDLKIDKEKRDEFIKKNNWDHRCDEILEKLK